MNSTLALMRVAELYYPIMLAQQAGEISESKACELLGMSHENYRETKAKIISSVLTMLDQLPSPLILLLESMPVPPS